MAAAAASAPSSPAEGAQGDPKLSETAPASPAGAKTDAEDDDDSLAGLNLKTRKKKKRKPGSYWNGKMSDLTLEEYREMKWSLNASFGSTMRRGAAYTMRSSASALSLKRNNSDPVLSLEVYAAYNKTQRGAPSASMGALPLVSHTERSQGPAQYNLPSTMDPKRHPTIAKHTGAKIGTEVLACNDEATPAPGDYDHEAFKRSARTKQMPAYTAPGREAWLPRSEAPNPGPGEYKFEHCERVGKCTPVTWSMQGKTDPISPARGSRRYVNPGPPQYNPPGVPGGAKNETVARHRLPEWRFGSQPRGLV